MAVKFGDKDWKAGFYVSDLNAYLNGTVSTDALGVAYGADNPMPVTLEASAVSSAFTPTGEAALSVTTTSDRVALGSSGPTALVINTGANTTYVEFGGALVVATTAAGTPIPSGWGMTFDIGAATHLAAITAFSTSTLTASTGTGMPDLVGGSAVSGGSTTNLTAVGGAAIALGQAAMAASLPVVIASNQTAVPVAPQAIATGGATYLNIAAGQATTVVKASAGTLYAIVLNSAATANNTTVVYDNASGAGTVIGRPAATTATVPTTLTYGPAGAAFALGLTIITATANGSDMTVIYK